jgi:hypothetical protein
MGGDPEGALDPDQTDSVSELHEFDRDIDAAQIKEVSELNYDWNDVYPYGEKSEFFFQDVQGAMYEVAGGGTCGEVTEKDGELYVRYWGQGRYDAEEMDQIEAIADAQRQRDAYF